VVYQYGGEQRQLGLVTEGENLMVDYVPTPPARSSPDPRSLNVVRAAYGRADVTGKVQSLITSSQTLGFVAGNVTFGDTWPGTMKSFAMTYSWGPAANESLVLRENQAVTLRRPPESFVQEMVPLAGLIADGDVLALKAWNGNYLVPEPATGRLLASAPERTEEAQFTAHVPAGHQEPVTLSDAQGRPVIIGPDGTLTASTQGTPARLVLSMTKSGSITMGVIGSGRNFSVVQADASIRAGGTDETTFNASYALDLQPTEAGTESLLRASGAAGEGEAYPVGPLATVVWDLTGGFFLAIGLGPLIAGSNLPKTGIVALIRQNAVASAALDTLIDGVRKNLQATISMAALFTFVGAMWDAGIMMQILRLALSTAKWWLIGWAAAKLLEWTILPEAAAAELVASFAIWASTTTLDVLALVNAMSHPVTVPLQAQGPAEIPVPT
jgi:hypothetical protein